MHTLALIQSLLDGKGVDYRVEPYSASTVDSRSENRALGLARVAMCRGDSELLLAIYPRSPEDMKQRAFLRYSVGDLRGAATDAPPENTMIELRTRTSWPPDWPGTLLTPRSASLSTVP